MGPVNIECPLLKSKAQTSTFALMAGFRREERGSLTIFSIFMIVMMLGIMGLAVDFMRSERNRTVLQHTLDRAILAAADLDQERPPVEVVNDYFETAGLESSITEINAEQGLNYKTLNVSAEVTTSAPYLDMLNRWVGNQRDRSELRDVDENGLFIAETACSSELTATEETYIDENGEERTRMDSDIAFRTCNEAQKAKNVPARPHGSMITSSASGAAEERVSNVEISLVLDVSGSMGGNNRMTNLKNASETFIDTVLQTGNQGLISVNLVPYDEHVSPGPAIYNALNVNTQHYYSHCIEFDDSEFSQSGLDFGKTYTQMQHSRLYSHWGFQCPTETWGRVKAFSQNATALKNQINQMQPSGNTHIFMGMKWATAMLDPSFNSVVTNLVSSGNADADFSDRPAAFEDVETLKTIVLMTDGVNTSSYRLKDWVYNSPSEYAHWNSWGIRNYLNRYVRSSRHGNYYFTRYWGSLGDTLLNNICDAAKANGIVIWSIGLEVNDHGANVMQSCASSPSHFFRVEGLEIEDAFGAIARQINQLRLTQ